MNWRGDPVVRLELIATILLAAATVATAWSGYQASRWNGEQAKAFSRAGALRVESAKADSLANTHDRSGPLGVLVLGRRGRTRGDRSGRVLRQTLPPRVQARREGVAGDEAVHEPERAAVALPDAAVQARGPRSRPTSSRRRRRHWPRKAARTSSGRRTTCLASCSSPRRSSSPASRPSSRHRGCAGCCSRSASSSSSSRSPGSRPSRSASPSEPPRSRVHPGESSRLDQAGAHPGVSVVGRQAAPWHPTGRNDMATTIEAPKVSDEQLAKLLDAVGEADSVELKLTVPLSDRTRAGEALGVDPLEGQLRQVYFFDTPDLALNKLGPRRARPSRPGPRRRFGREAAARSSRTSCPPRCATRRTSGSRSTRCPAAPSCAPAR